MAAERPDRGISGAPASPFLGRVGLRSASRVHPADAVVHENCAQWLCSERLLMILKVRVREHARVRIVQHPYHGFGGCRG
jgi:hypothetical protein